MKNLLKFSLFLLIGLSTFSCGSKQSSIGKSEIVYASLADYLRTVPGVRVNGNGNNIRVFITKGVHNATTIGPTPLFVVEGQQIGSSIRRVMEVIDHNEIKRTRVINPGEATIRYGINGTNGAIEFFMKK